MGQIEKLVAELTNDSEQVGYASMTAKQAADSLNAEVRDYRAPISMAEFGSGLFDLGVATKLTDAEIDGDLNAKKALNAIVRLKELGHTTVDLDHVVTSGRLDAIKDVGLITAAERAGIAALGDKKRSRAAEIDCSKVTPGQIEQARAKMGV